MELLKNPVFLIGIFAGLILSIVIWNLIDSRKYRKMYSDAHSGKNRINNLLSAVQSGSMIDLNDYYKQPTRSKEKRSVGYLVWRDLALWLACVYDEYKYPSSPINDYFSLSRTIFGDSCAYIKLEALNETLNRSTAYLIPGWPDEKGNKELCRRKLFELVFMIIDSYSDDVYERARADIKH